MVDLDMQLITYHPNLSQEVESPASKALFARLLPPQVPAFSKNPHLLPVYFPNEPCPLTPALFQHYLAGLIYLTNTVANPPQHLLLSYQKHHGPVPSSSAKL